MESLSNPPSLPVEAPDHKGWKTSFSKRLASKKITEEFEYFATQLDKGQFDGPGAVRYALSHATKRSKPDDFVDDDKKVKELPEGSKVCIVGAGMAGLFIPEAIVIHLIFATRAIYCDDPRRIEDSELVV